jgi:hypothetical protein
MLGTYLLKVLLIVKLFMINVANVNKVVIWMPYKILNYFYYILLYLTNTVLIGKSKRLYK